MLEKAPDNDQEPSIDTTLEDLGYVWVEHNFKGDKNNIYFIFKKLKSYNISYIYSIIIELFKLLSF